MGKKDGKGGMKRKRSSVADDDDDHGDGDGSGSGGNDDGVDYAELQAVRMMRAERQENNDEHDNDNNDNDNNDNNNDDDDDNDKKDNDKKKSRVIIYNNTGLVQSLQSMETINMPFLESMHICKYELVIDDENDDLQREMAFYNHALTAAKDGRRQLVNLNVPIDRPLDYFCESLKSDAHMARIKDRLITEEKKMAAFEDRKQRDINKKFNKQVAALKKSNKTQSTKQFNEDVTNLRKDSSRSSDNKEDKEDKLNKILTGAGRGDGSGKSKKRLGYDKKYGHGGKESKSKKSTSKSINDLSDYNPRGGKFVRREDHSSVKKGKKGGKGSSRPGKNTRDKKRSDRGKG